MTQKCKRLGGTVSFGVVCVKLHIGVSTVSAMTPKGKKISKWTLLVRKVHVHGKENTTWTAIKFLQMAGKRRHVARSVSGYRIMGQILGLFTDFRRRPYKVSHYCASVSFSTKTIRNVVALTIQHCRQHIVFQQSQPRVVKHHAFIGVFCTVFAISIRHVICNPLIRSPYGKPIYFYEHQVRFKHELG